MKTLTKLVTASLILTACASSSPPKKPTLSSNKVSSEIPTNDLEALTAGHINFAVDIYKKLSQNPEKQSQNIFISPFSISTAFGLAYAGARGDTAQEMATVMHYGLPEDRLHTAMGQLLTQVEDKNQGQIFNTANALFVDKSTILEPDYVTITERDYRAADTRVDYKNEPKPAIDTINNWVKLKTHGLIPETFKYNQITNKTRNVMVNTAYLKAGWVDTFDEALTEKEDFTTPSGTIKTSMMHQTDEVPYMNGRGYSSIALAYKGGTMTMIAMLPNQSSGLPRLEKKLSPEFISDTLTELGESHGRYSVDISFPKIDITDEYKLQNDLNDMGMKTAFSDAADFSGRIDPSKQTDSLSTKLGKVIHKTVLKVDEEGTEAAAVTGIDDVVITGARRKQPKKVKFKADHSFIMLIRHNKTGAILFMGRINNPISK